MKKITFNLDIYNPNIHSFKDSNVERMLELLEDSNEHSEYKQSVLGSEVIDLSEENVLGDINSIIHNIDSSLTPLEKLRLIYISLGYLFSYDYRVIDDTRYATDKVIDMNNHVGRYQTCVQISDILCKVLNGIDGIDVKVIERRLDNSNNKYGQNHVANEVRIKNEFGDTESYLLDLTLDLYLIQSGCRTMHFGYETGPNGEYDIIPHIDTDRIDQKLGLVSGSLYTDESISIAKENIKRFDFRNMDSKEIVDYRIINLLPLVKTFPGYHEGRQYINMLFKELLQVKYKEFNMYAKDGDLTNFKTCFLLQLEDYEKWIIYSNKLGLISTDKDSLKDMLENEWTTNSETLKKLIYTSKQKVKKAK